MTNKRPLSEDEKKICSKSLLRLSEQLKYYLYQVEICELKLDKGLMIEHEKNVRDYKRLLKDNKAEVDMLKKNIEILEDQIKNGVEIKKIENRKEDK